MPFDLTNAPLELSTDSYDFPVSKQPLFTRTSDGDMKMLPKGVQMAVVREDTDEVLATVGARYEITPHKDAFDAATEALMESGIDVSGLKVNDGLYEKGARARRTIILPQHVVQPQVGDRMQFKIDIFNALDGRWAFRSEFGYHRLVCLNGMIMPEFSAGIYAKHTATLDVEGIAKRMTAAMTMMESDEETFAMWVKTPVTEAAAGWFFSKTLARVKRRGREDDINKTLHGRLMSRFSAEKDSAYGLWNAMTAWSTHEEIPRGAAHNVRVNRENGVAAALRSPYWDDVLDGRIDEKGEVTVAA